MPWLEERTLTLFVRDTEVRRYEPGVRERGVDVERPSGPLMGSADTDTDTDTDPDRALPLKAVIHGHLIRKHFFHRSETVFSHYSFIDPVLSIGFVRSRPSQFTEIRSESIDDRRRAHSGFTRVHTRAQRSAYHTLSPSPSRHSLSLPSRSSDQHQADHYLSDDFA